MNKPKNVLIAQSGGCTQVINASLRGVIDGCKAYPHTFGTIYTGRHGIEGVLREELLNISAQRDEEIARLSATPAAGAIGTCRYKLKANQQADFERIIDVLKAHNIGYFFYNGGNDSMDTAHKVAQLAQERGLELVATGIPKTIDNDVGDSERTLIDHTPGYGSVARYWAYAVQEANQENAGASPSDPVLILQAMGRKIGYIPAAARLADPQREMPLLIFIVEAGLTLHNLTDAVNDMVKEYGRAVVVVGEGLEVGDVGVVKDSFGHTMHASSKLSVGQLVTNHLNEVGLAAHGAARFNIPGTAQRSSAIYASTVDLEEAYRVGQKAAQIAVEDGSGFMSTILRKPGPIYEVYYDKVPLGLVANSERHFPQQWIAPSRTDVTDDFLAYARPLIGDGWPTVPLVNGIQRFTRFDPVFAEQKLDNYTPMALR